MPSLTAPVVAVGDGSLGVWAMLRAKDSQLAQQKEQLAEQGRQIKLLIAQKNAERAEAEDSSGIAQLKTGKTGAGD